MKRTINTPHDVVQILIDIIVTNESTIDIFTLYESRLNFVKVSINTSRYLFLCFYSIKGYQVEIRKFKKKHISSSRVLKLCSFRVHGEYTDSTYIESFPEKIKMIYL